MIGKWIDIVLLVFIVVGLAKGFRKGLIRELFSIVGAIFAIIIAYHSYQGFAVVLGENYALSTSQSQVIAFLVLLLGISFLGAAIGIMWSKALNQTALAIFDQIAGAVFGMAKVGAVIIILLILFSALNIEPINIMIDESKVVQHIGVLLPFVYNYLEYYWPENWNRPLWLFPNENPATNAGFSGDLSFLW